MSLLVDAARSQPEIHRPRRVDRSGSIDTYRDPVFWHIRRAVSSPLRYLLHGRFLTSPGSQLRYHVTSRLFEGFRWLVSEPAAGSEILKLDDESHVPCTPLLPQWFFMPKRTTCRDFLVVSTGVVGQQHQHPSDASDLREVFLPGAWSVGGVPGAAFAHRFAGFEGPASRAVSPQRLP